MKIENILNSPLAIGEYILLPGEVVDIDTTDTDYDYCLSLGYINLVDNENRGEKKRVELSSMKKDELIELCKKEGIETKGKKVVDLRNILKKEYGYDS